MPKSSIFVSSVHITFSQKDCGLSRYSLAKISCSSLCLFLSNVVFLGLRPWSLVWFSVWRMVLVETMTPESSRLALRSLDVWCGVFYTIHTNIWRLLSSIFLFPPCPERFLTVPCLAKSLITLRTVETGTLRSLEMTLLYIWGLVFVNYWTFDVLRQLLCLHHCDKGTGDNRLKS